MKKEYYYIFGGLIFLGGIAYLISKDRDKGKDYPYYLPETKEIDANSPYGKNLQDFANNKALVSKLAKDLHDAMKTVGTDFKKILKTLENIDENQFKIIYKAFGKRPYYNSLWIIKTAKGALLDLKEWFKEELDDDEYQAIQSKYPNVL